MRKRGLTTRMSLWSAQRQQQQQLVRTRIGHGHNTRTSMLEGSGNFVFKFTTINGLAAPSGARGITTLHHKVTHNAMKGRSIVVTLMGEGRHVVTGTGCVFVIEFDHERALLLFWVVKQFGRVS